MITFERNPKSYALQITPDGVSKDHLLILRYKNHIIAIGNEPYSIVIALHGMDDKHMFRIEGLRFHDTHADIDILYTGTFDKCVAQFQNITKKINTSKIAQLNDLPNFDFMTAIKNRFKIELDYFDKVAII